MVIEVGERPLDPGIAPRAVLRRHSDDPLTNLRGDRWPPPTAALVAVVLPSDQRPMPSQQGVRGHDGPQLLEHASAQYAGLRGQANPLIVGEPEPPRSQLLAENAILLLQIVDDVALLLVDPAGQRDQKEPERMAQWNHGRRVSEPQAARVEPIRAATAPVRAGVGASI